MFSTNIVTWVMIFWLKYENKKLDMQEAEEAARGENSASGDTGKNVERFRYIF